MTRGYSAIGLISPKCNANIGGALRACSCYNANLILVQGARYFRQVSDTTAASRHIPLIHSESILDSVPLGCVPVCVEISDGAKSIIDYVHPERALYIFGPEDGSVPKNISSRCRETIYIPTSFCMNLASTVNVVLYDRLAKKEKKLANSPI